MLEKEAAELLSAYADHELSGEELTLVQVRLANSGEWREELEKLKKTKTLITSLPRISAPVDLLQFLEGQARQQEPREHRGFSDYGTIPIK